MPLTVPWFRSFCSLAEATSPFQLVSSASTLMPGNFSFMHAPKASERSRPLIEARSPSNSTIVPLPLSFWPRNSHAFWPYALLSARTTMKTLPWSGRVSTLTTGMFLLARSSSVLATAAVSCGAMTIALAPSATRVFTFEASWVIWFCELVRFRASMFMSLMPDSMYLAYEFQKSESERGWSMPTLPLAAPPLAPPPPELPPRLQPAAVSATSAMPAATTAVLRLSMGPHLGSGCEERCCSGFAGWAQPQPVHPAVDSEHGAGGRAGQRAGEVGDRGRDLLRADQPATGLARLEGGQLGVGVGGRLEQPAYPRRVRGTRVHAGDPDALGQMIGRHRQRQRLYRTLAGAVQGTVGQAGVRRDGARVDDRRVGGAPQVRQRRPGGAHHADHVHVEHPVPLLVGVALDGALRTDAGVVHHDVDAAHGLRRGGHRRPYARIVAHVGLEAQQRRGDPVDVEVEGRHLRAALGQQCRGGQTDARAATGD